MKYKNTKTGAVLEVKSSVTGGNWQAVESATPATKKREKKTEDKTQKK